MIGRRKFTYDLWGDTVNTGKPQWNRTACRAPSLHKLFRVAAAGRQFQLQARGAMEIKGKGEMNTFLLAGAARIPNG